MVKTRNFVKKVVSSLLLSSVLIMPLTSITAHAADITVPAYGTVYKTGTAPYTATVTPKVTNSEGKAVNLTGGEFTITQTAEYDAAGATVPVSGTPVTMTLTEGSNVITFSEDGEYKIENTKRVPGYLLGATEKLSLAFPLMENGVPSANQNVAMAPKLTPVIGAFSIPKTGNDGQPLEGVTFELVKTDDIVVPGFEYETKTMTTGSDGMIHFENLPEGTYELRETDAPAGYAENTDAQAIAVTVGDDNAARVTYVYNNGPEVVLMGSGQAMAPAFTNFTEPEIDKKAETQYTDGMIDAKIVEEAQSDKAFTGVGQNVKYQFDVKIPVDIDTYKTFTVTDVIDAKLDATDILAQNNVSVMADGVAAAGTVTYDAGSRTLKIDFTPEQRLALKGKTNLQIGFTVKVAKNAGAETEIPNTAVLTFDNNHGTEGTPQDNVTVINKEGALQITKQAGDSTTMLAGAEFEIWKEDAAGTFDFEGKKYSIMRNPNTDAEYRGTTDGSGLLAFMNIPFGDYIIRETKAPAGYRVNNVPTKFTINDTTSQAIAGVEDSVGAIVTNYKTTENFPGTGTMGVVMSVAAAGALIGGTVLLQAKKRKEASK